MNRPKQTHSERPDCGNARRTVCGYRILPALDGAPSTIKCVTADATCHNCNPVQGNRDSALRESLKKRSSGNRIADALVTPEHIEGYRRSRHRFGYVQTILDMRFTGNHLWGKIRTRQWFNGPVRERLALRLDAQLWDAMRDGLKF